MVWSVGKIEWHCIGPFFVYTESKREVSRTSKNDLKILRSHDFSGFF